MRWGEITAGLNEGEWNGGKINEVLFLKGRGVDVFEKHFKSYLQK